jgi:hypothetical protein
MCILVLGINKRKICLLQFRFTKSKALGYGLRLLVWIRINNNACLSCLIFSYLFSSVIEYMYCDNLIIIVNAFSGYNEQPE